MKHGREGKERNKGKWEREKGRKRSTIEIITIR
jgi:hypothetical protein